jgi:hypothetical protein
LRQWQTKLLDKLWGEFIPRWLPILSWGSIILGLATAAVIAIDIPPPRRAGAGRPTPASVNVAKGRKARLEGPPRERPESAPKPSFHCDREIGFTALGRSSAAEGPAILLGENDGGNNAKAVGKAAVDLKKRRVRVRIAWPLESFKDFNDMVSKAPDLPVAFKAVSDAVRGAKDFVDPLDELVERAKTDPGAPFELEALEQLAGARREDPSRFERLIARLSASSTHSFKAPLISGSSAPVRASPWRLSACPVTWAERSD